jgi:uncharacterized protein YbaA (DUF1428 family)
MYVDGFLVPVPKNKVGAYIEMAKVAAKVWREHGALEYRECIAEDVKPGKVTSFPQAVIMKKNETVAFSWITYKSRADRDRIMKKVMTDPRLADMMDPKNSPFDVQRMVYGGFDVIVDPDARIAKPTKKAAAKKK